MTEVKESKAVATRPSERLKAALAAVSVQEQFNNALKDNAPLFIASLVDLYTSDKNLQNYEPKDIIAEGLKAATLKLPINKSLGFAYIVPYKNKPTFTIGYKGLVQLAMRTGFYKYLNADVVYQGELKGIDKLTGKIDLSGEAQSDEVVGYFAHLELLNGFSKTIYWTKEKVHSFAKAKSPSYGGATTPWKTDTEAMCLKTVLRQLITKFGYMSIDMLSFVAKDMEMEEPIQNEIRENANQQTIDVDAKEGPQGGTFDDVGDLEKESAEAPY